MDRRLGPGPAGHVHGEHFHQSVTRAAALNLDRRIGRQVRRQVVDPALADRDARVRLVRLAPDSFFTRLARRFGIPQA